MTKIYLIRHAEAEGNLYRVLQGQYDTQITDEGQVQIRALGERFRDIHVDAVYSSDLYRAAATAAVICRVKGLPLNRLPALREIDVGCWSGKPMGEKHRLESREQDPIRNRQDKWSRWGGETPLQVQERMLEALQTIAAAHEGQSVAVVSHGAAICYVAAYLQGVSLAERGGIPIPDNTSVTELEAGQGVLRMVQFNDASHLDIWMEKLLGRPCVKRATGLEPGLWYRAPEAGEREEWLRGALTDPIRGEADVLLGVREEEPAGVLALLPEKDAERGIGWIDALWVKPELRCRSYGIQLLGQAVYRYRELGRSVLRLAVGESDGTTLEFLRHHGFVSVGETTEDGRAILEKDIAFHPLGV